MRWIVSVRAPGAISRTATEPTSASYFWPRPKSVEEAIINVLLAADTTKGNRHAARAKCRHLALHLASGRLAGAETAIHDGQLSAITASRKCPRNHGRFTLGHTGIQLPSTLGSRLGARRLQSCHYHLSSIFVDDCGRRSVLSSALGASGKLPGVNTWVCKSLASTSATP